MNSLLEKLYWIFRIVAYVSCIAGLAWFFTHRADANGGQEGLVGIYIGFFAFFVSYGLRFYLRFRRNRNGQ